MYRYVLQPHHKSCNYVCRKSETFGWDKLLTLAWSVQFQQLVLRALEASGCVAASLRQKLASVRSGLVLQPYGGTDLGSFCAFGQLAAPLRRLYGLRRKLLASPRRDRSSQGAYLPRRKLSYCFTNCTAYTKQLGQTVGQTS